MGQKWRIRTLMVEFTAPEVRIISCSSLYLAFSFWTSGTKATCCCVLDEFSRVWRLKSYFQTFREDSGNGTCKVEVSCLWKCLSYVGWPLRSCPHLRFYSSLISLACPHSIRCLSLLEERKSTCLWIMCYTIPSSLLKSKISYIGSYQPLLSKLY